MNKYVKVHSLSERDIKVHDIVRYKSYKYEKGKSMGEVVSIEIGESPRAISHILVRLNTYSGPFNLVLGTDTLVRKATKKERTKLAIRRMLLYEDDSHNYKE
jgi:hypothetical protein